MGWSRNPAKEVEEKIGIRINEFVFSHIELLN
jgi:hypothetical protein